MVTNAITPRHRCSGRYSVRGFPETAAARQRPYSVFDRGITQDDFNTILSAAMDADNNDGIDRSEAGVYLRSIQDDMDALVALNSTLTTGYSIDRQELHRYVSGKPFRDTVRYPVRWERTQRAEPWAEHAVRIAVPAAPTRRGPVAPCRTTRSEASALVQPLDVPFPSSGTQPVTVEDTVYMYFGWWSRQITATKGRGSSRLSSAPKKARWTMLIILAGP